MRVRIRENNIELGSFLKLAGVAQTGGQAKSLLLDGLVRVNGLPETRRGRKLTSGDVVSVEGNAELMEVHADLPD